MVAIRGAQRHQRRFDRPGMIIPIAIIRRVQPGRGQVLIGAGDGDDLVRDRIGRGRFGSDIGRLGRASGKDEQRQGDGGGSFLQGKLLGYGGVAPGCYGALSLVTRSWIARSRSGQVDLI